jgi:hypothetical protein
MAANRLAAARRECSGPAGSTLLMSVDLAKEPGAGQSDEDIGDSDVVWLSYLKEARCHHDATLPSALESNLWIGPDR